MNEINVLAENLIKLEEVKLEPVDHAEEQVWNFRVGETAYSSNREVKEENEVVGEMAYSLKREMKQEEEEEELKPPVRIDIREEFIDREEQEHEDPLAVDNENALSKTKCLIGGESTHGNWGVGMGSGEYQEGNDLALTNAEDSSMETSARNSPAEVKMEPDDHAGEQVWNSTVGEMAYSLKREIKEEEEEEELKPPVRIDIREEFIEGEEQEHEDPLAVDNESALSETKCLIGAESTLSNCRPGMGSCEHQEGKDLALPNAEDSSLETSARILSAEVSHFPKLEDIIHEDENPVCEKLNLASQQGMCVIPKGKGSHHCFECQKSFNKLRDELIEHMKLHSTKLPFECSICRKSFSRKGHLQSHMRVHSGERPFECSICLKSFSRQSTLKTHLRIHSGERPFVCLICQKSFTSKVYLGGHMRIHGGERPFVCSICQKSFSKKKYLESHMRIHSGERPFKCSICQKSFSGNGVLTRHMRIHSGERPYECSICQKSFSLKSSLVSHMRVHNGERRFECSICQKSFSLKSSLVSHKRVHNGERRFECSICQKSFSRKDNLITHMHTHNWDLQL